MNCTLTNVVMFTAGAVIGSLVTYKIVKTKYERIAQEEIDSVKERFRNRQSLVDQTEEDNNDIEEYVDTINEQNYTAEDVTIEPTICLIDPTELGGDDYDYEVISCTYYANGILVEDETEKIIEDIKNTVGLEFMNHFGDYEQDVAYVRNEYLKCDYEILRDLDPYIQPDKLGE